MWDIAPTQGYPWIMTMQTKKLDIVIYRISGKQFFFNVPSAWCEECDLTIAATRQVLREMGLAADPRVRLTIKPWLEFMGQALAQGGWHAPVLLINGRIFSQGIVPQKAALKAKFQQALSNEPRTTHQHPG